jgi:hypothetical protein
MNADARHGGLRPKRGLPAKLHFENRPTTHYRLNSKITTTRLRVPIRASSIPQVSADHNHSLKARQLTLFYQLLPHLCRIRAQGLPNCDTVWDEFGATIKP